MSALPVPPFLPAVTQSPRSGLWHHLNKHDSVAANYRDDFCRWRTLTSRRAGGGTKVQKCVVVSLRGWDVEIHSSPVALEKFINQWGIWWFVQAYGRTRLARFSWRPLWGGLQAIHKSCWSALYRAGVKGTGQNCVYLRQILVVLQLWWRWPTFPLVGTTLLFVNIGDIGNSSSSWSGASQSQ